MEYNKFVDPVTVYENYARAMSRRRPGSELEIDGFLGHWAYSSHHYGTDDGSVILGGILECDGIEIFMPSHFAPSTLTGGARLFKTLAQMPCVLAITSDLVSMAVRCGFIDTSYTHQMCFRGEAVTKHFLISESVRPASLTLMGLMMAGNHGDITSLLVEPAYKGWVVGDGYHADDPLGKIGLKIDMDPDEDLYWSEMEALEASLRL